MRYYIERKIRSSAPTAVAIVAGPFRQSTSRDALERRIDDEFVHHRKDGGYSALLDLLGHRGDQPKVERCVFSDGDVGFLIHEPPWVREGHEHAPAIEYRFRLVLSTQGHPEGRHMSGCPLCQ